MRRRTVDEAVRLIAQIRSVALAGALLLSSCSSEGVRSPEPEQTQARTQKKTCRDVVTGRSDVPVDYAAMGRRLEGDVDGDGGRDRVTLRSGSKRPERCRRVVVVETAQSETFTTIVEPLDWPSTEPRLRSLAQIDGRPGLEVVVALSPAPAVYRPGTVFTLTSSELVAMRLRGRGAGPYPQLLPFFDEFPAGVDCTGTSGEIVITNGLLAPGGDDSKFRIIRVFYRAAGTGFRLVDKQTLLVGCCDGEAARRWPEVADDPFRSCSG